MYGKYLLDFNSDVHLMKSKITDETLCNYFFLSIALLMLYLLMANLVVYCNIKMLDNYNRLHFSKLNI